MKLIGMMLFVVGMAGPMLAPTTAPEIDSSSLATALALLSGSLLVIRGRRKSKKK